VPALGSVGFRSKALGRFCQIIGEPKPDIWMAAGRRGLPGYFSLGGWGATRILPSWAKTGAQKSGGDFRDPTLPARQLLLGASNWKIGGRLSTFCAGEIQHRTRSYAAKPSQGDGLLRG